MREKRSVGRMTDLSKRVRSNELATDWIMVSVPWRREERPESRRNSERVVFLGEMARPRRMCIQASTRSHGVWTFLRSVGEAALNVALKEERAAICRSRVLVTTFRWRASFSICKDRFALFISLERGSTGSSGSNVGCWMC